jgi:hypothetical protein
MVLMSLGKPYYFVLRAHVTAATVTFSAYEAGVEQCSEGVDGVIELQISSSCATAETGIASDCYSSVRASLLLSLHA